MGSENFRGEYSICSATQKDIPDLVRMRINLQDHMERVNDLILRYKDEWRNELPLLYNRLIDDSKVFIIKAIATKNNEVVGMMVGKIQEHPQFTIERSVKIDDVWIDIDHRQRGICTQLLSYLQEQLADMGIEHFTLNYVVNNNEAEQTWRALGFSPIITNCAARMKD